MREKLIELLQSLNLPSECDEDLEWMADHLIANGVTIQKWIPVTERLPEPESDVLTFCFGNIDILSYRYNRRGYPCFMFRDECGYWKESFGEVSYWMPLPEPTKEEI